jgi:DNA-binding beta-propeller fold protein YncE
MIKQFAAFILGVLLIGPMVSIAQIPDDLRGTLIVLNKSGHDASFIDLGSGEIIATLPTGRGPHELVVTDDGKWAIGTDYSGGNSLTVFDIENLQVTRTIDLSDYPRPHGLLFLPGQEEVIVTSEGSRNLVVVNFHTGEIVRSISTGQHSSHMVAMSANGSVAYTINGGTDSVSIVDVVSGQLVRSINVPNGPEAITTNKSGSEIWVGSNDHEVVSVISASNNEITAQWDGFDWPYRILLTDDERYAIMPDLNNSDLRFFDAQTKVELGAIDLRGTRPQGVTLYSDDRTLFLSLAGADKVMVIDIESRTILGEYETGSSPDGIGYSPLVLRKTISYQ